MLKIERTTIFIVITFVLFMLTLFYMLVTGHFANFTGKYLPVLALVFLLGLRRVAAIKDEHSNDNFVMQYSQMDTVINNSPFIILLRDTRGKVLFANKQLSKFLDIKTDNIVGCNIYTIYNGTQADYDEDKQIFLNGKSITSERQIEINSKKQWFKITKIPIKDKVGNVVRVIVILENTEGKKVRESDKSSYIATLTHDLKTPTFAQIRAADLLLSGLLGELSSEQKEIITQMKSSCNYMNDLIFTILDSYLYDNGQNQINAEKFNLVDLVLEVNSELSALLTVKGQKFRVYSPHNVYVTADKMQIKRVIVNLLGNAITYGMKNSIINITIMDKLSKINLNVRNKSENISTEMIEEMFEKFRRSSNAKYNKTGSGLGLYLTKQIINAHGGRVYAKKDMANNCDFGFELPKEMRNTRNGESSIGNCIHDSSVC